MGSGEGLGGCHACIKYLMFAFNFIFWLIGCALVGVGIWILVDDGFKNLIKESEFAFLQYGGIGLIVVGGIIMLVGFFGCCGAIRESQCLLVLFFICMLLLFVILVAAGVACLVYKDKVTTLALDAFDTGVRNYKSGKSNGLVDLVQQVFHCCGYNSAKDYISTIGPPPDSCPKSLKLVMGCKDVVLKKLSEHVVVAAGIALGSGAVMLLGMIFSMMLCCAIRDED